MAMGFMAQRKPRGLFGGLPDYMTPGGGIGGSVQNTPDPVDAYERIDAISQPPAKKKGGLFGSRTFKGIAGTIGDALLQHNDLAPVFAPTMQLRQRAEMEEQQYQRRRGAELQDYRAKKGIDAEMQGPEWGYEQDNAGNRWRYDKRTGKFEDKPVFVDRAPKQQLVPDGMGGYRMITIPNPFAGGGAPATISEDEWNAGTPIGGVATPAQPPFAGSGFVPPQQLKHGRMTSGRRTPEGNRLVGGVPDSDHLTGRAADYWGPDLNALLGEVRSLPGQRKSFIHGKGGKRHVHGSGDWNAPYHGKNGTKGLKR